MYSFSQLGQDTRVVEFYKGKRDGFFVEIGANNGIELSNTFLLERVYGWKGICCEPIPPRFSQLVSNRPQSLCCNGAVYHTSGLSVTFDINHKYDLLSGITDHLDETIDDVKTTISVFTISLLDLLDRTNAPLFIDYMSIDTEGSEYEILRTFDFKKYTFGLIDVEHNYVEPRRTDIRNLLVSNGYLYKGENKWDDMYQHSSMAPSHDERSQAVNII